MTKIKLVVFDCDGVMFDTAQANRFYYSSILQHFARPALSDEQFAFVHMHTLEESMAYLFPDETTLAAAYEFRKCMDYSQYLRYFTLEPDLVSLLKRLRPEINTAVATNRTDTMNRLLAAFDLDGLFDLVVTASDVRRPKPYPDVLLKVLDYFKVAADQTLYIGDSRLDEMAAGAANIPLVAYRNPNLSSDHHITTLKEIEAILKL